MAHPTRHLCRDAIEAARLEFDVRAGNAGGAQDAPLESAIPHQLTKPSIRLELMTPSLPSSEGQGTRGFRRVRKAKKVLHVARDVVDALAPEVTP
jgi:hypothetical protein